MFKFGYSPVLPPPSPAQGFFCLFVYFACMYVWCPGMLEQGTESLGTRVNDGCEIL